MCVPEVIYMHTHIVWCVHVYITNYTYYFEIDHVAVELLSSMIVTVGVNNCTIVSLHIPVRLTINSQETFASCLIGLLWVCGVWLMAFEVVSIEDIPDILIKAKYFLLVVTVASGLPLTWILLRFTLSVNSSRALWGHSLKEYPFYIAILLKWKPWVQSVALTKPGDQYLVLPTKHFLQFFFSFSPASFFLCLSQRTISGALEQDAN